MTYIRCDSLEEIKIHRDVVSVEDEALMIPNPRRMLKVGLLLLGIWFCVFRIC